MEKKEGESWLIRLCLPLDIIKKYKSICINASKRFNEPIENFVRKVVQKEKLDEEINE